MTSTDDATESDREIARAEARIEAEDRNITRLSASGADTSRAEVQRDAARRELVRKMASRRRDAGGSPER